jgi:hypothetical protein
MSDEVWRALVEVGMLSGFDICDARRRILEVDGTGVAAHYRLRLIDMGQAERVAKFMRGYIEQNLARRGRAA